MSATILWKIVKPEGKPLGVAAPSAFRATMERAFGEWPVELDSSAIPKLEGMAACWDTSENPFTKLSEILENVAPSHITVWAEY